MAQKNISDYYAFCKKKSDTLQTSKPDNAEEISSPAKRKKINDDLVGGDQTTADNRLFKKQKASLIFDTELSPVASNTCTILDPVKSPLATSQQSILKWIKNTNKLNRIVNPAYPNLNLIQAVKQQLPDLPVLLARANSISPTAISPIATPPITNKSVECKAKKRLFNDDLAELSDQIESKATNGWLQKLKEFQAKVSPNIKISFPLRSPFQRYKEQEQRKMAANNLMKSSPRKFLENVISLLSRKSNDVPASQPDPMIKDQMISSLDAPPANKAKDEAAVDEPNQTPEKPADRPKNEVSPVISLSPLNLNSPPVKDRGLELPAKYLELAHTFNQLETVVTIMYNRQETCTFDKAKQGVQKLTKKDFNLKHLAQILTIYPDAYKLNHEKLTSIANVNGKEKGYRLVIKPNVLSSKMIPYTNRMRMNEFKENLHQFAKKAHCDYLLSLDEPVLVNSSELTRWHPSFIFPEVTEAKLPEPPVQSPAIKSIRDFWCKLNLEQNGDTPKAVCATLDNRIKIKEGILKGLSQNFLEKVRVFLFSLFNRRNPFELTKCFFSLVLPKGSREAEKSAGGQQTQESEDREEDQRDEEIVRVCSHSSIAALGGKEENHLIDRSDREVL